MNGILNRLAGEPAGRARIGVDRRTKAIALAAVALLHLAVIALLVRAFGVDTVVSAVRSVTAFAIPLPPPPPSPTPEPQEIEPAAAAPAAPKARPKEIVAPRPKISVPRKTIPAPPVAGSGSAAQSGASVAGPGSGAGGTGAGSGGETAPFVATKAVKVSGDIVSARDYPRDGRAAREGASVMVALTIGINGRVKGCSVVRASPDPQADTITCRLAAKRFRFRPAFDQYGRPIESTFGWRQSWFT